MNAPAGVVHRPLELIERFFTGELAPEQWEPLLRHVDTCSSCRAHFQTTQQAFKALSARQQDGVSVLGSFEAELIGRVLLSPPRPRRRLTLLWAGLASAAAIAGLALVLVGPSSPSTPEMNERGSAGATRPGFDILCLPAEDAAGAVSSRESAGHCQPDSYLKVMVTVPGRGLRHVTVFAVDRQWQLRFVTRAPIAGQAAQILPGHGRLSRGDRLFFRAIFSPGVIDDESVRRAIDKAREAGAPPDHELALPGMQATHEIDAND